MKRSIVAFILSFVLSSIAMAQGNVLNFDGVNDHLYLPIGPSPSAYTIEMWVRPASTADEELFVRSDNGGPDYAFSHQLAIVNGKFEHYTFDGEGNSVIGSTVIVPGQWYHVAIVAENNSAMRLFVNGTEEGAPLLVGGLWTGGNNYYVGRAGAGLPWFRGSINEIRIWNIVRTQAEIAGNMNNFSLSPATPGLQAYYALDQGTAAGNNSSEVTAVDSTSNAYNGTLVNFALSGTTSNWISSTETMELSVSVETAADGTGSVVPAQDLLTGNAITVYAISRAAGNAFVANVPAVWSLLNKTGGMVNGDLVVAPDGKSATVTGLLTGTASIAASYGPLAQNTSGTITVVPGTVHHFSIASIVTQSPGIPFAISVAAKDANNNTVTSFTGTVSLSTNTGTISPLTSDAFVNGVLSQSITVTDTSINRTITVDDGNSHTGTSNVFTVRDPIVRVTSTGGTLLQGYQTLSEAFTAVNSGTHTGTVSIAIMGNTVESASAVLSASGSGAANYTTLSIQPSGGAARTISGTVTGGTPLIDLNGADNVTINGLNTGGNALTIVNSTVSSASQTSTIRFINGATNNVVTNCTVKGSFSGNTTTSGGTILFGTDAVTGSGNDDNTVSYCMIGPAGSNLHSKAISAIGSTSSVSIGNSGIVIRNNEIYDYFAASTNSGGISVLAGNNYWTIINNRFYQTAQRTWTGAFNHRVIEILSSSSVVGVQGFDIAGNTIGYADGGGSGTYSLTGNAGKFIGIYYNGFTGGAVSRVSNNSIAAISITGVTSNGTSTSSPFTAILISNGWANTDSNTIGSQTGTGSLTFTTNTTGSVDVHGIFNFSFDNTTVIGNVFGGITVNNSSASTSAALQLIPVKILTSSSNTSSISANIIGGTTAHSIQNSYASTGSRVFAILNSVSVGTISMNIIRNLTGVDGIGSASSASVIGISCVSSSVTNTISQNTLYNLSNTSTSHATTVTGILYTASNTAASTVERNVIHSFSAASPSAILNGMQVAGGLTTVKNNMIRLGIDSTGTDVTVGLTINGINENGGSNKFYHNSVYIGGSGVGGSSATYALFSSVTSSVRDYRNNIVVNARSNGSGTGKHYAVNVGGSGVNPIGLTIDYNIYHSAGTGGVFGRFNFVDITSLDGWRTAVGQDNNSVSIDPHFKTPAGTSATVDLHLDPSVATAAEQNGVSITDVTDDIDGQTRSGLTPVDIGADAGDFIMLKSAPVCILTSTTSLSQTGATLNGTVKSIGLNAAVRFLWGSVSGVYTDSAAGTPGTATGNSVQVSNVVSGLTQFHRYYFVLAAVNDSGYARSSEGYFNTSTPDTTAGYALSLDGIDDYIAAPSAVWFSGNFTIEGWVNERNYNSWSRMLDFGNGPSSDNVIIVLSTGTSGMVSFHVFQGATAEFVQAPSQLSLNEWNHIACVWNAGTATIYINGVPVVSGPVFAPLNVTRSSNYIGRSNWADAYADAAFDEIRIWNTALDSTAIRENMHRIVGSGEANLVDNWHFGEGNGSTLGESHGYPASLVNTTQTISGPWIVSTMPAGAGTSTSASSFTSGTVSVGPVAITTTEAYDTPVQLTSTEILAKPNVLPGIASSLIGDRYFILNAFGDPGLYSVDLTLTYGPGIVDNRANTFPAGVKLYRRSSTSDGAWTEIGGAASASSGTGSITWSGITQAGQYAAVYDEQALPVELVSFTASPVRLNAELRWKTATEVNNHGFEIERKHVSGFKIQESGGTTSTLKHETPNSDWTRIAFVEGNGNSNVTHEYSYTDRSLSVGKYSFRLKQIDLNGTFSYSSEVEVTVGSVPNVFALEQNYPNPFNPSTTIGFTLQLSGMTTLKVYDAIGREVVTLANENLEAGVYHQRTFDASQLSSGIYFARLVSGGKIQVRKLMLVK
ncbi:MAG: LamG-like jellyroll fold domain-containing protein [Bacteroidota bacterium]